MRKVLYLLLLCFIHSRLAAATYVVNTTADAGAGSLRQAITSANAAAGPDLIQFNIPLSDPNYNAGNGTWTITVLTELPYISGGYTTIDGLSQSLNQGNTNPDGPELVITCSTTLDYAFALVSPNNSVKGFVVHGFNYGILFYNNTSTGNIVSDNYCGTGPSGNSAMPNSYGIGVANGASGNTIRDNLISGNQSAGIGITQSNANIISSNRIGTDISGTMKLPNYYGIAIDNASSTVIGTTGAGNLISGNLSAGIVINGTGSKSTVIHSNYIGTNIHGTDTLANGSGIILAGASQSQIGSNDTNRRNIISGNLLAGIALNGSGTRNNVIRGNYVGTDKSGMKALSNHTGILLKSQSNQNTIGGSTEAERNIISGNFEIGVYIEGCDSNLVIGNFMGPDRSGNGTFYAGDSALQGNGLEINTFSRYNRIGGPLPGERNVMSGNRVYGLVYYGNSASNNTSYNFIGTNAAGTAKLANATGICVDGGSNHNVINNNLLSGNLSYGIFFVTTGTYYNTFMGNKVGTNADGTDTIPNYIGVIIAAGTRFNLIGGSGQGEGNLIAGNLYNGIEMADLGTDYNEIRGNIIGSVDPALAGNYNGLGIATHPRHNIIENNEICLNRSMGIILFEHADSNLIRNNRIGCSPQGTSDLGNGTAGIAIVQGASANILGPDNIIAYNDTAGIIIDDNTSTGNTITRNQIHHNGMMGIDLFPFGVNTNDAGDPDGGPNLSMNYPMIQTAGYNPINQQIWISGIIDYNYITPLGITIELYRSSHTTFGHGEGIEYLGTATVDAAGNWQAFVSGAGPGDYITATATDTMGNTSEFAADFAVVTSIGEESAPVTARAWVFPNPASGFFTIQLIDFNTENINIQVFSATGNCIKTLYTGSVKPGIQSILAGEEFCRSLPTGLNFIRIQTDDQTIVLKINILR